MKFLDNLKAASAAKALKRANDAQLANYQRQLGQWQANKDLGASMLDAFTKVSQGTDAVNSGAVMKAGEFAIWSGPASYHESKQLPGSYVGRSNGISVPLGHGFRYRTGATKGTFVPGNQVQATVDSGTVIMTTHRVIFNGNLKTQEWAFEKWTGADASDDERIFMIHVTNRQKVSGVNFPTVVEGNTFNQFLGFALQIPRSGLAGVIKEIQDAIAENEKSKPVQPAPLTE